MASITCILGFGVIKGLLTALGIPIGLVSLIFLFGASLFIPFWGNGGTERWVAYHVVIWLIGFGTYFTGSQQSTLPH
jgi:hypothetical protein